MDAPQRDLEIDAELLAQAQRLGLSVTGLSETQLRLHLQKVDPAGRLGRKIGSLLAYEDEIRRALGRLFTGF